MLEIAKNAVLKAGKKIIKIYNGNFEVEIKEDDSPITIADKVSNKIIINELEKTGIKILSEEKKDNLDRLEEEYLWIIDPVDGTKDFINKTGEFSIMIGLVKNGKPILGVVYAPTTDKLYYAEKDKGAYLETEGKKIKLEINKNNNKILISRNHTTDIELKLIEELGLESVPCGSIGVKFGLIAEGKAGNYLNLYSSFKEWDTCAPEIILTESGGQVTNINGNSLIYNKEIPTNNGCIATNTINHNNIINKISD